MVTLAGADQLSQPVSDGGTGTKTSPTLVPQQGQIVTDQDRGRGLYSRTLTPYSFSLSVARDANNPVERKAPGNVLQVLAAQGGVIPDDARISIGGSDYYPLIEGFVYESDEPFQGFALYWPTASAGVTLWVLVALGRGTPAPGRVF